MRGVTKCDGVSMDRDSDGEVLHNNGYGLVIEKGENNCQMELADLKQAGSCQSNKCPTVLLI